MASKPTVDLTADEVVVVETPQPVLIVESSSEEGSSSEDSSSEEEAEVQLVANPSGVPQSTTVSMEAEPSTVVEVVEQDVEDVVEMTEVAENTVVTQINVEPAPEVGEQASFSTPNPVKKKKVGKRSKANSSGLSLLASYGSGSEGSDEEDESDDDDEVLPVVQAPKTAVIPDTYEGATAKLDQFIKAGEYRVISDSSEEESDDEPIHVGQVVLTDGDDDSDVEIVSKSKEFVKAKGEMGIDDLPPIEDLQISVPEEECIVLGKIFSVVEQLVLVDSIPGAVPLDLDTVLFLDKGNTALGRVFDVLGNISEPLYCVRFNSNEEIIAKGLTVGTPVYVAPKTEHTNFIILGNLMGEKGCDASWEHDIESARCVDYSDDEEERAARKVRRGKKPAPADDLEEGQKRHRSTSVSSEQSSMNGDGRYQHPRFQRGGGRGGQQGGSGFRGRGGHFQPQQQYQNSGDWNQQRPDNFSWHNNLPYNGPPPHSGYQHPPPPQMMNPYGHNNGYPFQNQAGPYNQYPPGPGHQQQPSLQQMYGNQPMYGHPQGPPPPMQHHQQPPPPGSYYQKPPHH